LKDLFYQRDLENMLLLLKAILKGSLLRTESRGSSSEKIFQIKMTPIGKKIPVTASTEESFRLPIKQYNIKV